ncbi:hypothetical protein N7462_006681 [Penicillium macrosclerotiorum]|uniref:uncharacterized protein n=1 Tax=Penicillium macrosclerotiorum TaxID=303699 RepID=UPI0025494C4E|nr:uncharacterized protein N7462_006681 [Penicillium macrosclerotiorum]KAJ5683516.1 hypothetical protein N7462_006681 [Penicillium macrosclerotiorum]
MSTKAGVMETTTTTPAKRSFGARIGAHFKKWWWLHLIVLVIIILVVVLPVIYVAYPKIAQRDVNDSTLNITSMSITDPKPESFVLNQTQVIGSHSSYHPQIYAFEAAVSLAGAASAFTTVKVPAVKSKDGAQVDVSQTVDLSNATAFGDFATAVMLNEEVSLNIYGKPELKEGGLPKTTVTYNKTVTMKGLNKLKGFDVTEFHIMLSTKNGRNMNGTVFIPNPSVMTLEMGNLTLGLSVAGQTLGYSYLDDLILKPGNNTVPMTANVNESAIISFMLSDSNPYTDGVVPFQITGNSSVYNGQELPYFTEALSSNNLTVNLNVTKALAEINISL